MKVLFVSAEGKNGDPKVVVRNQGVSLIRHGLELRFFTVSGRGLKNYIISIPRLRKEIKLFKPDIVHAHYSFSGLLASLACARPLVVSLMGSDARLNGMYRLLAKTFIRYSWRTTIVKSEDLIDKLGISKSLIIPNGVDTDMFKPIDKNESLKKTGFDEERRNIIFVADPRRPEKNFNLAREAVELLNDNNVNLIPLHNIENSELPYYYNSADLLLLTSLWEGSPNVVKEAMACNLPVVATEVGDIRELLEGVEGCFIASFRAEDVCEKIRMALSAGNKRSGRNKIFSLGVDSDTIATRLKKTYLNSLNSQ